MKKMAFTLAEVLITLGVIGIVAAMTLPGITQTHREKQRVTQLKRFYSVISNAFMLAVEKNGPLNDWGVVGLTNNSEEALIASNEFKNKFISNLKPYLNTIYECKYGDSKCEEDEYKITSLDGTAHVVSGVRFMPHLVLNDGSTINHLWFKSQNSDIYGEIYIDLNGSKIPNKLGEDIFVFGIQGSQIVPYGINTIKRFADFRFDNICKKNRKSRVNGYGCAGWVIFYENQDYLHCNDLSVNGKHKCK